MTLIITPGMKNTFFSKLVSFKAEENTKHIAEMGHNVRNILIHVTL